MVPQLTTMLHHVIIYEIYCKYQEYIVDQRKIVEQVMLLLQK